MKKIFNHGRKRIRVAINGFGRIGRSVFKAMKNKRNVFEVVTVNDLCVNSSSAVQLLKYDSSQGKWNKKIEKVGDKLIIDGEETKFIKEVNIKNLPWAKDDIDLVVESTGIFTSFSSALAHVSEAGAKKVVISAPATGDGKTIVYNVNHENLRISDKVISCASCTTNCLAPVISLIHKKIGIRNGFMTTVHAITNDQKILDNAHKDPRRAYASGCNIIPTSTGAAAAIGLVIPEVKGLLDGIALRVPVGVGSIVDLTLNLKKNVTTTEINNLFKENKNETLAYNGEEFLASSSIIGESHGSIVDGTLTMTMKDGENGSIVKIFSWYDNETSYVSQLLKSVEFWFTTRNN